MTTLDHAALSRLLDKLVAGQPLQAEERAALGAALPDGADLEQPSPLAVSDAWDEQLDAALLYSLSEPTGDEPTLDAAATQAILEHATARPAPAPSWLARALDTLVGGARAIKVPYLLAAGAVAMAAWFVLALPTPHNDQEFGLKGLTAQVPPEVHAMFVVAARDGERVVATGRGVPGNTYSQEQLILLRYRLSVAAHVCVIHQSPDGAVTILQPTTDEPVPAGEYLLGDGDDLTVVELSGQPGQHTFAVIAGDGSLACTASGEPASGVAQDRFTIEVR